MTKGDLWKLGAPTDDEREFSVRSEVDQRTLVDLGRGEIARGIAVDGKRVDDHLKEKSLVPVHVSVSTTVCNGESLNPLVERILSTSLRKVWF